MVHEALAPNLSPPKYIVLHLCLHSLLPENNRQNLLLVQEVRLSSDSYESSLHKYTYILHAVKEATILMISCLIIFFTIAPLNSVSIRIILLGSR